MLRLIALCEFLLANKIGYTMHSILQPKPLRKVAMQPARRRRPGSCISGWLTNGGGKGQQRNCVPRCQRKFAQGAHMERNFIGLACAFVGRAIVLQ